MSDDDFLVELKKYEILEDLCSGGMGTVFKIRNKTLDRIEALKVIKVPNPKERENFHQETKLLAALKREIRDLAIPEIYELKQQGDYFFYTMEYCQGTLLREKIDERQLSVAEAVEITIALAQILQRIHDKGIIHHDVKPRNVIVDTGGKCSLVGFGARSTLVNHDTQLINPMLLLQNNFYIDPDDQNCRQSDIFALAKIFYEMLTFTTSLANSHSKILARIQPEQDSLSDNIALEMVVDEILAICQKGFHRDREQRYYEARDFCQDITRLFTRVMPRYKPPVILLVEDDLQIHKLLKKLLTRNEYKVISAYDGEEALRKVEEHHPDLMILDLFIPSLDGHSLLLELRHKEKLIPTIVVSEQSEMDNPEIFLHEQVCNFLVKPLVPQRLMESIREIISTYLSPHNNDSSLKGDLRYIGLFSILQMLAGDEITGCLQVKDGELEGEIYFLNGNVIHSQVGDFFGIDAFFQILDWHQGRYEFFCSPMKTEKTIAASLDGLLLEWARRRDEGGFG